MREEKNHTKQQCVRCSYTSQCTHCCMNVYELNWSNTYLFCHRRPYLSMLIRFQIVCDTTTPKWTFEMVYPNQGETEEDAKKTPLYRCWWLCVSRFVCVGCFLFCWFVILLLLVVVVATLVRCMCVRCCLFCWSCKSYTKFFVLHVPNICAAV